MKLIIAILILIVSDAMARNIDLEGKTKMMMDAIESCKASTGASDLEIIHLMMHKQLETKEGKCMSNCFYETIGMLKDGKLNKEGVFAWGNSMGAPKEIISKITEECEEITDPDICESGMKIGNCLEKATMKHALNFD
ncbi:hypothetical protein PVAND_015142 [Polypedilum vanderplanki]|uniref:Odorant binding protein n=1 Tax=Polypedilum vanderplanki TaxID=319348 RepID=A0A9J6BB88_POLVA|nr:hypothetical protein PVAND_015142 [Polypedilum vanderplanki]